MSQQRPTRLLETPLDEYLERRIEELALPTSVARVRAGGAQLEQMISVMNGQASALITAGLIIMFVIVRKATMASGLDSANIIPAILLALVASPLLFYGFRRKKWRRYLSLSGFRSLSVGDESSFRELFSAVNSGTHSLMRIANDGMGSISTPVSHRPVDLVLGKECLSDPWFAAKLFGKTHSDREFLAISQESAGDWFQYYLWHAPIAERLLDLFDRTPQIYLGDHLRRTKVRIALREIAAAVSTQASLGQTPLRKDVVVAQFERALRREAEGLRSMGKITELEYQQLRRLNITGESVSHDPAETSGNRGRKPESWFLNLMAGQYAPINRPLSETVRKELNIAPGFFN